MLSGVSTPLEPIVIAENGAFVVAEIGPRVLLIDRGRVPTEVGVLLLAMSTLIFGGFGVVSVIPSFGGDWISRSTLIGFGFLLVGIASFRALLRATAALNRSRATPLSGVRPVAVFDRNAGAYLDGNGEMIAHLSEIRFSRAGFGSRQLVVTTPHGDRVLVTGSVGNLDQVLTHTVATHRPDAR
ncbi:hypothetical protein A5757_12395 [Mycobacterium sp. 852013-51886_SCH5428379]|nr:hypothetical protein A5757_12395 [Mycobacterium sp. 852013-51886_SCH5428379]